MGSGAARIWGETPIITFAKILVLRRISDFATR